MSDAISIDGFGPLPRIVPQNSAELGELIRAAITQNQGLYPWGGGAFAEVGLIPTKAGQLVDMQGFNQIIDYPARDLTITAQAGITVAKLQEALAAEGQQLPVDLPHPEKLTLGAALALNLSGPRRLFRGTLRDYVIGISQMTDEGQEVKGGGRVVKNVAGYDLMKLQVGALGTLGIITQATLKVVPRPEEQGAIAFGLNAAAIGPTLDRLHNSAARPVFIELLNTASSRLVGTQAGVKLPEFDPWVIIVGFEEKATTIDWQMNTLREELKSAPSRETLELHGRDKVGPLLAALTDFQAYPSAKYIWKANVLPSRLAEFVNQVGQEPSLLVQAHALSGIIWLEVTGDDYDPTSGSRLADLDQAALRAGGNLVVRRCPLAIKKGLRIWGRPSGENELMRTIKATMDPHDVFNPGRLFS